MKVFTILFLWTISMLQIYAQSTWTGNTSTNWNTASNWSPSGVPTSTTDVIIPTTPTGGRMPSTQAGASDYCRNLTIQSGATLTVNQTSGYLYISGNFVLTGTINQVGANYVMFNGIGKTISMTGTWSNTGGASALRIEGSGNYTLATNINPTHVWIEPSASLNTSTFNINTKYFFQQGNFTMGSGTLEITESYDINIWANVDYLNPYFTPAKFTPGTGTVFYNGVANAQRIRSATYNNLKIRVNNGFYAVVGDGTLITCNGNLEILNPNTAGGTLVTNSDIAVAGNFLLGASGNAFTTELRNQIYRSTGTGIFTMGNASNTTSTLNIYYQSATNKAISGFETVAGSGIMTFTGTVMYDNEGTQLIMPNTYNHLTLRNVGTKNLTANTIINGNLLIQSATLDVTASNFAINLRGNWTNQGGNFTERSGTVTFDGTTAQTITTAAGTHDVSFIRMGASNIPSFADTPFSLTTSYTISAVKQIIVTLNYRLNNKLYLWLEDPNGANPDLSFQNGGSKGNYNHVIFDDASANTLPASSTNTTLYADYRPMNALSTIGSTASGTWKLHVDNDYSGSVAGTFVSYQMIAQKTTVAASTETFNNIVINNTSTTGVTLMGVNAIVSGAATFTDGYLYTGESQRVEFTSTATTSLANANSYIVGWARKIGWTSGTAFEFPLGNDSGVGNRYPAPVRLTPNSSSATAHFTATYRRITPNTGSSSDATNVNTGAGVNTAPYLIANKQATIDHVSNVEYWIVERTNGTVNATVHLSYDGVRSGGTFIPTQLLVCHWNKAGAGIWEDKGNGGVSTGGGFSYVQSSAALSTFSPLTLGSTTKFNVLPVTWLTFEVAKNQNQATITWKTANEINNSYFDVEKSTNGIDFQSIAKIQAKGNTNTENAYSFQDTHTNTKTGYLYYRIKQTDIDHHATYTNIKVLEMEQEKNKLLHAFPNPTQDKFMVEFVTKENEKIAWQLIDLIGNIVQEGEKDIQIGTNTLQLSLQNFAKGYYFLRIYSKTQQQTVNLVKD